MLTKNEHKRTHRVVALIPARSGSKRVPNKNIKLYNGKPLIYWSINLALQSTLIDEVVVSTDCQKIASLAVEFGASVPFLRPLEISGDLSTDYEFMAHYIDYVIDHTPTSPDIIVHLRPTYPNRDLATLNGCIERFIENYDTYDSLRTVCKTDKPPFKMYTVENNVLTPLFQTVAGVQEPYNNPVQLLPCTYWHNGYVDVLKTATILLKQSVSGNMIYPYVMDSNNLDDIDTDEDWVRSVKNSPAIR